MLKKSHSFDGMPLEVLNSLDLLGQRIRANRIAQGWTVKETAARLFCSQNTYRSIEMGKPTSSIGNIANALWLFGQPHSLDLLASVPINLGGVQRVRHQKNTRSVGSISEAERDF